MKITKAIGAIAASAMMLGLAIPASAAGLMNVTTTGTTQISGTMNSKTSSWDTYSGVQVSASLTQTQNTSVAISGSKGTHLNVSNGQANFAEQSNVTVFQGGDSSSTTINGHINQTQTTITSGIETSFGN